MSHKTWYHNLTSAHYNESDISDFFEEYTEGDIIMKSEDGCAIIEPVSKEELDKMYTEYITQYDDDFDEEPLITTESMKRAAEMIFGKPEPLTTGIIIPKMCECGDYKPTSSLGVIIEDCVNCGCKPPTIRTGL